MTGFCWGLPGAPFFALTHAIIDLLLTLAIAFSHYESNSPFCQFYVRHRKLDWILSWNGMAAMFWATEVIFCPWHDALHPLFGLLPLGVKILSMIVECFLVRPKMSRFQFLLSLAYTSHAYNIDPVALAEFCRRHQLRAFPFLEFARDAVAHTSSQFSVERIERYRNSLSEENYHTTLNTYFDTITAEIGLFT
jgi:hypothetical protein